MNRPLVIVDFSNFVWTCWFPAVNAEKANAALYPAKRVVNTNMSGKLDTLRKDLAEVGIADYDLVFMEDRRSKRKYDLFPAYKANREERSYDPRPAAKEWLMANGHTNFACSPDNEADDAIATMVTRNTARPAIIIASSDRDLWQLIAPPRVMCYHMSKGYFATREHIFEEYGVTEPKHIPLVKALWGDSGDNVPNAVPRMQKQLLPFIQASDGSLDDLKVKLGEGAGLLTKKCKELLVKGYEQVNLNYDLVKLDPDCVLEEEWL